MRALFYHQTLSLLTFPPLSFRNPKYRNSARMGPAPQGLERGWHSQALRQRERERRGREHRRRRRRRGNSLLEERGGAPGSFRVWGEGQQWRRCRRRRPRGSPALFLLLYASSSPFVRAHVRMLPRRGHPAGRRPGLAARGDARCGLGGARERRPRRCWGVGGSSGSRGVLLGAKFHARGRLLRWQARERHRGRRPFPRIERGRRRRKRRRGP